MRENRTYKAEVRYASKELTAKEKIAIKDTNSAHRLDEATDNGAELAINVDWFAQIDVHNEKSDNKDYNKIVLVDTDGEKYVTGSEHFTNTFLDIYEELCDSPEAENLAEGESIEPFSIIVRQCESKNYKGKTFLTCELVCD